MAAEVSLLLNFVPSFGFLFRFDSRRLVPWAGAGLVGNRVTSGDTLSAHERLRRRQMGKFGEKRDNLSVDLNQFPDLLPGSVTCAKNP